MQRLYVLSGVLSACLALAMTPGSALAQSGAEPAPLRTPHGNPDIGGVFTFRTLTPLQGPVIDAGASAALKDRVTLTEEEAAAYEAVRQLGANRSTESPSPVRSNPSINPSWASSHAL